MRRLLVMTSMLALAAGCVHYAEIEQVQMGMSVDDVLALDTPCYYRGASGEQILYNCKFRVPAGDYSYGTSVKPYVMTFRNGKLTEIDLDERELDRQDRYYDRPGYYYYYGYPYYHGYPYRYGYHYWW